MTVVDLGSTPQPRMLRVTVNDSPSQLAVEEEHISLDLLRFHSGRWALQLDSAFARRADQVVILAQGLACLAVAWWGQLSPCSYLRSVRGAVFISPITVDLNQIAAAASLRTGPKCHLPFPSVVVSDPIAQIDQVLALADSWGSVFVPASVTAADCPTNRIARPGGAEDILLAYTAYLESSRAGLRSPAPHGQRSATPLLLR